MKIAPSLASVIFPCVSVSNGHVFQPFYESFTAVRHFDFWEGVMPELVVATVHLSLPLTLLHPHSCSASLAALKANPAGSSSLSSWWCNPGLKARGQSTMTHWANPALSLNCQHCCLNARSNGFFFGCKICSHHLFVPGYTCNFKSLIHMLFRLNSSKIPLCRWVGQHDAA